MKKVPILLLLLVAATTATAGEQPPTERRRGDKRTPDRLYVPFEDDVAFEPENAIDLAVQKEQKRRGVEPAHRCSDAVFLRRVTVDVLGRLPTISEVQDFLYDDHEDKRARVVDAILARDEYADYASLRWCDVLRVKSEFPINLWPNAVAAYHRWVHDQMKRNTPFDRVARDLLTSSGSNFRTPSVNFYRAMQTRTPVALASAVSLTFLGTRFAAWPEDRKAGLKALFSRVAYKRTDEWKEEVVLLDPAPAPGFEALLPDGTTATVAPDEDPRRVFADWLIRPENPWFSRVVVNRLWTWLYGRGIVHEPDDFRPDNPPSVPELLDVLAKELVTSKWDLKAVYRLILTSRTYQNSPVPQSQSADVDAVFARYPIRRLDAEVLCDTLFSFGGEPEEYMSIVPEPYTYLPRGQKAILIADGGITSSFLEMFGRPARDTGLDSERNNVPTDAQRLFLLNSNEVRRRINDGRLVRDALRDGGDDFRAVARNLFLTILSREPTVPEVTAADSHARKNGLDARAAAEDLAWALVNTKEFQCRH